MLYKFKYVNDDYEEEGLLNIKAPSTFDPSFDGELLAHDILEHFPNEEGSIEEELMALGAVMWVRGLGYYWESYRIYDFWERKLSPSRRICHDILNLAYPIRNNPGALQGGLSGFKVPNTKPLKGDHEWIEKEIIEATRLAFKLICEDVDGPDEWEFEVTPARFCLMARHWMRKGFRRAQKRYKGHEPEEIAWVFKRITDQVNEITGTKSMFDEGDMVVVEFVIKNRKVRVYKEYAYH